MAETSGLLNRRTGLTRTEGSNPSVSAIVSGHDRTRPLALHHLARAVLQRQPMRSRSKARPVLLLLLIAGIVLGGCQHVIEPPATVSDPVRVFVIDYGRHASLALPKEDTGLVEWSWGDWNWFALERTGVVEGLQALFASLRSTLSRRELGPTSDAQELARRVGAEEVLALDVERERTRALHRHLNARWLRRREEAVAHPSGRLFVPDDRRYGLFNNSVHELARWLEALGVGVSGTGVTADFKLREPRAATRSPGSR